MRLAVFNVRDRADAERGLLGCCAAPSWAAAVVAGRPYPDVDAVVAASDEAFLRLDDADLDAALEAHPRIGEPAGATSRREQSGVAGASPETLSALAAGNRAYEDRFGHVFLIFATGLTADEMLGALRSRLGNERDVERRIVREELRKITALRLRRYLEER